MQMSAKIPGLVILLLSVGLLILTSACYAKDTVWLGVVLQPLSDDLKEAMDIDRDIEGVLVSDVIDDSPADEYGLEDGDVIVAVGREDIGSVKNAVAAIKSFSSGDEVDVVVIRDGARKVLNVVLGERDEDKIVDLDFDIDVLPEIERAFKGWQHEPQGFLGVEIRDMSADLAEYFDVDEDEGVLVLDVTEDSPAEEAGIKAGDVILEFEGKRTDDTDRLTKYVRASDPGDRVDIKIKRKRRTQTVQAEIGESEGPARFFAQEFRSPGKHRRIIIPRGRDIEIPDIEEFEIQRLYDEDLREELENLKEELEELKQELEEIREQ
jgi:C-terminal processing protease CtpA/Prc